MSLTAAQIEYDIQHGISIDLRGVNTASTPSYAYTLLPYHPPARGQLSTGWGGLPGDFKGKGGSRHKSSGRKNAGSHSHGRKRSTHPRARSHHAGKSAHAPHIITNVNVKSTTTHPKNPIHATILPVHNTAHPKSNQHIS